MSQLPILLPTQLYSRHQMVPLKHQLNRMSCLIQLLLRLPIPRISPHDSRPRTPPSDPRSIPQDIQLADQVAIQRDTPPGNHLSLPLSTQPTVLLDTEVHVRTVTIGLDSPHLLSPSSLLPSHPIAPTRWPTAWPTQYPTEMVIVYTDKEIFGFDVGSRAANIATLIALILVIIWLALSTAYCITRGSPPPRFNHHNVPSGSVDRTRQNRDGRGPGRGSGGGNDKSRRQKFEEYWGEMDSSTNSVTPMHPTSDAESDCGSIEISDRVFSNQVDGQVLSSPFHSSLYQQQSVSTLPPAPQPSYQAAPVPPVLPKPPSDLKPPSSQTSDLLSLPETSPSSPPPLPTLSLHPPPSSSAPPPAGTGGTFVTSPPPSSQPSSSSAPPPPVAAEQVSNLS